MSSTEQRVVASRRSQPRPATTPGPAATPPQPTKESPRKPRRWLVALVLVLAAGFAGFLGAKALPGSQGEPDPAPTTQVEPGEVQQVDAISLNLAGGHYLRVGVSIQLSQGASPVEDSRVLDTIITLFSGRPVAEVTSTDGREALRTKLVQALAEIFEDQVLDVYFTDYVTQ